MSACGCEFYILVFNWISSSWTLEDKIHIHARACNILYLSVLAVFTDETQSSFSKGLDS